MFDTTAPSSPAHYGPHQTVLLLLDFHSLFVDKHGGKQAPAALNAAVKLKRWAKSQGIQIVHALIDLEMPPMPTCKGASRFEAIVEQMKNEGSDEPPALQSDADDEPTFLRRAGHVSALRSPGLEEHLRHRGVKSLLVAGLSTSGCVLWTSLAAADHDFVVTVIMDACADPKDGVHDFVVEKLLTNRGYVSSAEDFIHRYSEARASP